MCFHKYSATLRSLSLCSFSASVDGNSLFNACSLHLWCTEELAELLRVLKVLELFFNASMYTSSHPIFVKATKAKKGYKDPKVAFKLSMEDTVVKELDLNPGKDEIEYVKATAIDICEPTFYSPFLAVLALANVVRIPIHLYTQKCEERCQLPTTSLTRRREEMAVLSSCFGQPVKGLMMMLS